MSEQKEYFSSNIIGSILVIFLTSALAFFTYLVTEINEISKTQVRGIEHITILKNITNQVDDHEQRLRKLESK
ncbi:MAG: hypothetical protein DRQ46_01575 [Gammaproteobacteria bacterium]|nr:MAG: hypothetical protein DRQ46_01575 [Gammaproteobacteria bacterium]